MTVRVSRRVEPPGDLKLSPGADVTLILEYEDLVVEEGITDDSKVGICTKWSAKGRGGVCNKDTHRRGYRLALVRALRV